MVAVKCADGTSAGCWPWFRVRAQALCLAIVLKSCAIISIYLAKHPTKEEEHSRILLHLIGPGEVGLAGDCIAKKQFTRTALLQIECWIEIHFHRSVKIG